MQTMNLSHLALSDNGFLFDTATGNTFTLNATGTFILKGLINGMDLDDVTQTLVKEFEVDAPSASDDLERFMAYLKELDILL